MIFVNIVITPSIRCDGDALEDDAFSSTLCDILAAGGCRDGLIYDHSL